MKAASCVAAHAAPAHPPEPALLKARLAPGGGLDRWAVHAAYLQGKHTGHGALLELRCHAMTTIHQAVPPGGSTSPGGTLSEAELEKFCKRRAVQGRETRAPMRPGAEGAG